MNKKQIRLTESDLHRIVKESVNRILTELDWKTNASAGEKQLKSSGHPGRAAKFFDHAAKKFNQQNDYDAADGFFKDAHDKAVNDAHSLKYNWADEDNITDDEFKRSGSKSNANKRLKAAKEMKNYIDGNYNYKKGEGWKLNN